MKLYVGIGTATILLCWILMSLTRRYRTRDTVSDGWVRSNRYSKDGDRIC